MKRILLAIVVLLESCSSYRTIDLKTVELVENRRYKIKKHEKFSKVRITSVSDSIVFYTVKGLPQQIHLRDIKEIEGKKTDAAKVVAVTALTLGVLAVIAASQIEYKIKLETPLVFP